MQNLLRIFLATLILLLAFSDCKAQQTEKITHFDLITMERTSCYGTCPSYSITIRPDGKVQYVGRKGVKVNGAAKTQISRDQIGKLIEAFNAVDFFTLRDKYQSVDDGCAVYDTDYPSVIISIKIGNREKTVTHHHGCLARSETLHTHPRNLVEFENKIDKIVGSTKWTGKD